MKRDKNCFIFWFPCFPDVLIKCISLRISYQWKVFSFLSHWLPLSIRQQAYSNEKQNRSNSKNVVSFWKKTSWKLRFYCSKFPNVVQVTNAFSYSLETYFIAGVAIRKRDETRPDEERHLQRIQCGRTPNNFQICKEYIDTRKKVCTTVAALTQLHPSFQINWKMLLSGLFPQPPQPHDVLIVHNPTYLRKLGRIIALFGKR